MSDVNNPDLHLEHYQDGYNAGEQAGFERGVQAERARWKTEVENQQGVENGDMISGSWLVRMMEATDD